MKPFEIILDECVEAVRSGATTVEACLALYPRDAGRLAPLLRAASFAGRAGVAGPSAAFRGQLRLRLLSKPRGAPPVLRIRRPAASALFPLRRAAVLITLAIAALATGTAFAQVSVPGTPLYSVKRASEDVWRSVATDPLAVDLALSHRRADEWIAVASDSARSEPALRAYQDAITRLLESGKPEDHARILPVLQAELDELRAAGLTPPEFELPHGQDASSSKPADKKPEGEADDSLATPVPAPEPPS